MNGRGAFAVLGILVLVALVAGAVSGMMGPGMMWGMGPGMMWGYGGTSASPAVGGWAWGLGMVLGMVAVLAFWAALLLGVVLLVRWALGARPGPTADLDHDDALAILRRRYAAGEIDQPTYERMRRELSA
jgi:putative membrane protein